MHNEIIMCYSQQATVKLSTGIQIMQVYTKETWARFIEHTNHARVYKQYEVVQNMEWHTKAYKNIQISQEYTSCSKVYKTNGQVGANAKSRGSIFEQVRDDDNDKDDDDDDDDYYYCYYYY